MEPVFLRALAENPHDHVTRGVYADWLEEHRPQHAAIKAEFLRTTAVVAQLPADAEDRDALEQRLHGLAVELSSDWLSVVSCLPIENCHVRERTAEDLRHESPFHFLCDRRWEDLRPTDTNVVRFCDSCREQVHFCDSLYDARRLSQSGHCVAISPDLVREEGDIAPRLELERGMMFLGVMEPAEPQEEAP